MPLPVYAWYHHPLSYCQRHHQFTPKWYSINPLWTGSGERWHESCLIMTIISKAFLSRRTGVTITHPKITGSKHHRNIASTKSPAHMRRAYGSGTGKASGIIYPCDNAKPMHTWLFGFTVTRGDRLMENVCRQHVVQRLSSESR